MGDAVSRLGDRRYVETRQPMQRNSAAFDEWSHRFWTDDVDNPETTPEDKPFHWFRARQAGGKSTIWGRQVYRLSDLDLEAKAADRRGRRSGRITVRDSSVGGRLY